MHRLLRTPRISTQSTKPTQLHVQVQRFPRHQPLSTRLHPSRKLPQPARVPRTAPRTARLARTILATILNQTFIFTLLTCFVLYNGFPYTIRRISGASMAPTLSPELVADPVNGKRDWIVFRRLRWGRLECVGDERACSENESLGSAREEREMDEARGRRSDMARSIRRGALVLFYTPNETDKLVVKRVVGLPGDIVAPLVRRKDVSRAGDKTKQSRPPGSGCQREGLQHQGEITPVTSPAPVKVPFGYVWVEGDNPDASYDSNDYGPVSQSLLVEAAYGHWRLSLPPCRREHWEHDDWETRMGMTGADGKTELRLRKRERIPNWRDKGLPPEWKIYTSRDV